ncbi:hypothetical protein GS597_05185 [Synechococcales cyanobacterium C]|uniref:Circadian oscillating protein COP23 n=1 Tax=Petrachloros mirabilis ULC683 TaxID=2781853 RepID=A0A8K2A7F7_9CYAN|nr:COP23 domain-containing protein [Petrachloros mirabilis]NCJ05915.1 hypothetical protein [Petrachloros mirabilis ULC683]
MKRTTLVSLLAISALSAAASVTVGADKAQAQVATRFYCGQSRGVPATVAETPSGIRPVIRWTSDYFSGSGYTPEVRCKIVSQKFQQNFESGRLRYLTIGVVNQEPVICVAETEGGPCSDVLYTMKRGQQDAFATKLRLQAVGQGRASGPLNESTGGGPVYVSLADFVNSLPVEASATPPSTPAPTPEAQPQPEASTESLW